MSEKKHIDRLFQEKFKDFEETPNDVVWERIEARLAEKKKRRVIPIWWRYAGVAALLLLLITIGNTFLGDDIDITPNNQVVDTNSDKPLNSNNENGASSTKENFNDPVENTDQISVTQPSKDNGNSNSSPSTVEKEKEATRLNAVNEASVANVPTKNEIRTKTLLNTNVPSDEKPNVNSETNPTKDFSKSNVAVAKASEENKKTFKKDVPELVDKTTVNELINTAKNNKEAIADAKNNETKTNDGDEKKSMTIEEALEKDKDITEKENDHLNRWSVAPNAAPVFFNTMGKGSSIDPQFNNNSKTSDVNMSYGINASYALNKRLTVRSGINKVNLGYTTNDVLVFQSLGISSNIKVLKNIKPDINNGSNDISVLSAQNFADRNSESFIVGNSINTSINQSLSYIEIPLEIQYTLSDKKLGVNVIGGFSSLFLNDNELFSDFDGAKTRLGEASNVNDISYSANFGLGLNYKVSKKLRLNLEPIFKYQINTFNNTSGNFKPYFIGVYTGFGFKF